MQKYLLATKLFTPPPSQNLVPREHLIKQLNAGLSCKLTLVSAPAGFGKSVLLSSWVQQVEPSTHVAWLSLDIGDNDLSRFLSYIVASLQTIESKIGKDLLPVLQSSGEDNIELVLTTLLNEIAEFPNDIVLVLDDYHVIESQPIDQAITFLLDHLPSQMHLIIASRIDPSLPLSRLRASKHMTEIRAKDLRFSHDEAADFLNLTVSLDLSDKDIAALEMRTEGWITGLQLAALSMKGLSGQVSASSFVSKFTGSDRYIVDYLVDEVLSQKSKDTQNFLLQTSILERMTGPLCDAVTDGKNNQDLLVTLEKENLFLIPLDSRRKWYRYHHLFGELLRHRLHLQQPEIIPDLYIKASIWFEADKQIDEAIKYALLAKDLERATRLVDQIAKMLILMNSDSTKLIQLVSLLPKSIRQRYPRLCIFHAWALVFNRQLDAVEPILALAEAHLQDSSSMAYDYSASQISNFTKTVRVYALTRQGDLEQAEEISLNILEDLSSLPNADALIIEGSIKINLGIIYKMLGKITSASKTFLEAIEINQVEIMPYAKIAAYAFLMRLRISQGQLHQAMDDGLQVLEIIQEWSKHDGSKRYPVVAIREIYRELGRISYQWSDFEKTDKFVKGKALELHGMTEVFNQVDCYITLMHSNLAQDDTEVAYEYLRKIERLSKEIKNSDWRLLIETEIVKGQIKIGKSGPNLVYLLQRADEWVKLADLKPTDKFQYQSEFQYRTLVRVLISQDKSDQALPLLNRLCHAAESDNRFGHLIEYLILQALAFQAQRQLDSAISSLNRALILAQPEGYIRIFVDEGKPMAALLQQSKQLGITPAYLDKLLDAFPDEIFTSDDFNSETLIVSRKSNIENLIKPLSQRELDVLRLIISGLKNQDIAEELVISLNTVRFHIKNIYGKLNVHNRAQLIVKTRELNLLHSD